MTRPIMLSWQRSFCLSVLLFVSQSAPAFIFCLFICLSTCLPVSLFPCPSVHLSISPPVWNVHASVHLSVCLFSGLSVCLPVCSSVHKPVCLFIHVSVHLSILLTVSSQVPLSVCPPFHQLVCESNCYSVRLFIRLTVCLSVFPSTCLSVCMYVLLWGHCFYWTWHPHE